MQSGLFRKFWLQWTFAGLLAALCVMLAVVQYGWINQLSNAERARLEADFRTSLSKIGQQFNQRITASYDELKPSFAEITEWGTPAACVLRYRRWTAASEPLFRRIAIVNLDGSEPALRLLDTKTGDFAASPWPPAWTGLRKRFNARLVKTAVPPLPKDETMLLDSELPDSSWLVAEINLDYVRGTFLPGLLNANLPAYDWELDAGENASGKRADEVVELLQGWRLSVFHRGLALEDRVTVSRGRNVALSLGILILILAIVAVLLNFARQSQQLAELQMNFVAGVSHELRTPLTVIRTAAYNLRGRLAHKPEQVEKYAALIQKESETLSVVVEQVLRYGAATKGRAIGERRNVSADRLVRECAVAHPDAEQFIEPGLPPIYADELALKHAIRNLLDNAKKYGTEGSGWIGIFAQRMEGIVEIRVADRGPGIPADEQAHIFDAFFRGRRAIQDQMHGTGLGLSLVKKIIEAHGGTIEVKSESGHGAEFIVRLPAAEEELSDVFSNSID